MPVVSIRLKSANSTAAKARPITVGGLPLAITNRIFSLTLAFAGGADDTGMAAGNEPITVRPVLISGGLEGRNCRHGRSRLNSTARPRGVKLPPRRTTYRAFPPSRKISKTESGHSSFVIQDPSYRRRAVRRPLHSGSTWSSDP